MERLSLKKYGFKRLEERDFEDDGNNFKGYVYKGLPITYLRDSGLGEWFISLRLDYLGISYSSYKEDYRVLDEFNGVSKVDMEKLVSNCEYIIKKYNIKEVA